MKGLILPLTSLMIVGVFALLVALALRAVRGQVRRAAIRDARWTPYTKVQSDGVAVVGVELVARWGDEELVLQPPVVIERVTMGDDLTGEAPLAEAQFRAELRATTYNNALHGAT